MNSKQKRLWVEDLHKIHSNEDIAIMLNIDIEDVNSILAEVNGGGAING